MTTEAHGSTDWNIMLMTEYKDLATMEANEPKAEALVQQVVGMTKNSGKATATGSKSGR